MTKEELKQLCEKRVKMFEDWAEDIDIKPNGKVKEYYEENKLILDLIKALEQQPCEDCVSRENVKQFVEYIQSIKDSHNTKGTPINYGTICDLVIRGWELMELPPVTPTHGTCKDCKQGQKCEHGVYCTNLGGTNEECWYCADFEKRGNENGKS